jgi:DNA polymerase I-like protein with 3'-5' exonuclease and polymerase domains
MLEDGDDLPAIPQVIPRLFADFETASGHPDKKSVNPWRDCSAIGAAVAFGADAPVYWVPKRMLVTGWWRDVLKVSKRWTNQNVKYDAHVSANDLSCVFKGEYDCTLNGAKLIDSDRVYKGGYGLDVLSNDWCGLNIDAYGDRMLPYLHQNKDYGRVPEDILAEYACMDIVSNRLVADYIDREMPEESYSVWSTERQFTSLLFDMERRGVHVDPQQVKLTEYATLRRLLEISEELEAIVGHIFRPNVHADCYEVLINQYGLPIVEWTDPYKGKSDEDDEEGYDEPKVPGPSFNKAAMAKYENLPGAPHALIALMIEFRKLNTFQTLFLSKWQEMHINGVMHATYNQAVRTGRMSCNRPNLQQLSAVAKKLIRCPKGYVLVCTDACIPAHVKVITAYGEKPMSEIVANKLPVLGYDTEAPANRRLKFCDLSDAAYIRDDHVYRVNLENGSSTECTGDHGFIRLDGTRVDCRDLRPGDRLKHINEMRNFAYPQWRVDETFIPKHICSGLYKYEWKEGHQFHHIDEDKENWTADNIELKSEHDHKRDHGVESYARQDHTLRLDRLRLSMAYRDLSGEKNGRYAGGKQNCFCEVCGEFLGEYWPSQLKKRCRDHIKSRWGDKHAESVENHKVVSVEYVGVMPVYSLTNPSTHNYVTAEGLVNLNSQIEYRFIAHYIGNQRIIDAYNNDPWVDFHSWVAGMIPTGRKPAKTLNFMMGYGGGKKKTVQMLKINKDFVGDVIKRVDESNIRPEERAAAIDCESTVRAEAVYAKYHAEMPELKRVSRYATAVCYERGYVKNHYGRRRHLPQKASHVAFNSLCQSSAGDLVKERMLALQREVPEFLQIAQVHDEIVGLLPEEMVATDADADHNLQRIVAVLNEPDRPLKVPIRWGIGFSRNNWAEAKSDDAERKYFR